MNKPRSKPSARTAPRAGGRQAYAPVKPGRGLRVPPWLVLGVAAVAAAGLLVAVMGGGRAQRAEAAVLHGAAGKMARLGFRVDQVDLEGAAPEARSNILNAADIVLRSPILDVDLNSLRRRVEAVGWVKSAKVVRLLPDTVVISVAQRRPMAVWQHDGVSHVIDETGYAIGEADPTHYPDLPLVVGDGANGSAAQILALLRPRTQLMQKLEALVRVDDRRWDIRLNDGGLIQLPAEGEDSALIQLDQLDQKARILELGFARIDLRDPEMVAVRPKDGADGAAPAVPVKGA